MANTLGMGMQLAGNAARFGWYSGLHWLAAREAARSRTAPADKFRSDRPVPDRGEVMADLRALFYADAAGVRDGLYRAADGGEGLGDYLGRLRSMLAEIPAVVARTTGHHATTAATIAGADDVPDYYRQDFHFQTGGYLSEESARLYDIQVETLFYGTAAPMRRSGLRPLAEFLKAHDQRRTSMLDVACGTGRFLREVRLAFPALRLTGLDLSRTYLEEARRHLEPLRSADLIVGNAEQIPLGDASQDVVTCIFLFHELPGEVRRRVAREMARVLKPGGLLVFIDSLQFGDKPNWDGMLDSFPARFHEPYYRGYLIDDLEKVFTEAGLTAQATWPAFLSKVMVRRKG